MTLALARTLSISALALALSTSAFAQPKTPTPAPAPKPAPLMSPDDAPAPDPKTGTAEKAGTNETLQNGGADARPWANGVSMPEQQAALALFHDGNVQLNDGLFLKAAEKYRDALKHWDHPAIHYNLALALLNLDQPIEVYESLQKATQFGSAPLEKDKYEHAKEYLLLIEKQIADVEVSCDKPGAHVQVDGKEVFIAPGKFTGKVRIGKHAFLAEKEGYATRIKAPYIGPGEHFRIELKLYTSDELTRYKRRWQNTWFPYAVMGGGLLVGVGGGALEASARSSFSQYDKQVAACSMNNSGCTNSDALKQLRKDGDTKQNIAYVGYGVGIAAIAAGAALAILNREQAYEIRADDVSDGEQNQVTIAPIVAPGMAGAMVQGHF